MPDILTTNYDLVKPENGASADDWGIKWNDNADKIDDALADIQADATAAQSAANQRLLTENKLSEFDDDTKKSTARFNIEAQKLNANLTALSGLVGADDKFPVFTGVGTMSLQDLSDFAKTILDDATAGAVLSSLGIPKVQNQAVFCQATDPGGVANDSVWVW